MSDEKIKIAIVSCSYYRFASGDYEEIEQLIARSITDWVEVTYTEYQDIFHGLDLLNRKSFGNKEPHYILVRQHSNQQDVIIKSIEQYKQMVAKAKQHENQLAAEREKKRKEKEDRKKKQQEATKRKMYEELRKQFEGAAHENQS